MSLENVPRNASMWGYNTNFLFQISYIHTRFCFFLNWMCVLTSAC